MLTPCFFIWLRRKINCLLTYLHKPRLTYLKPYLSSDKCMTRQLTFCQRPWPISYIAALYKFCMQCDVMYPMCLIWFCNDRDTDWLAVDGQVRRHRTTAGHVAGTARIRGLVAGLQYSFDHQTRVFYDSTITRHLRRFTTLRPVLPARFLVLVSRRPETTAARCFGLVLGIGIAKTVLVTFSIVSIAQRVLLLASTSMRMVAVCLLLKFSSLSQSWCQYCLAG